MWIARFRYSFICLTLMVGTEVPGDTIFLDHGKAIEGTVVESTADHLIIELANGQARVTLSRKQVLQVVPGINSYDHRLQQGYSLLKSNRNAEALRVFSLAQALRPTAAGPHRGRSLAHAQQSRFEEALRDIRLAILLAPQEAEYRITLGMLLAKIGKFVRAEKELRIAYGLDPSGPAGARAARAIKTVRSLAHASRFNPEDRTHRSDFDKNLGNNREAAEIGAFCLQTRDQLHPLLPMDVYIELKCSAQAEINYRAGGPIKSYRANILVAQISARVEGAHWTSLHPEEIRTLTRGWLIYLKDRFPIATCIAIVADNRGIRTEAIWSDLRQDIVLHRRR